jgi:hypothetical protein
MQQHGKVIENLNGLIVPPGSATIIVARIWHLLFSVMFCVGEVWLHWNPRWIWWWSRYSIFLRSRYVAYINPMQPGSPAILYSFMCHHQVLQSSLVVVVLFLLCDNCERFWCKVYVFRLTRLTQICQLCSFKLFVKADPHTNFAPIRPVIFAKQNLEVRFDTRVLSLIIACLKVAQ